MLRIVVYGYVVRAPLGGFAWHHLQYVSGLLRLGHDVVFVEDGSDPAGFYNPQLDAMNSDPSHGLHFIEDACNGCGIGGRWAFFDAITDTWHGPRSADIVDFCATADLLINLNDPAPLRPWLATIPVRALIDTDPVFMQVRNLQDSARHADAAQHNVFFTFAENLPAARSTIPPDGFPWQPTRQPIDLALWQMKPPSSEARWTTVMQWDSYKSVSHGGVDYGMKSAGFADYSDLPSRTHETLEIALGSGTAPKDELVEAGWRIADPIEVSRTPWTYRDYLESSKGEFSVAKLGYVSAYSGWFSERTACYLACGRPAVVQDTGFSSFLPTGEGLLPFRTCAEAVTQLDNASHDYARHCTAAREIAREYFAAETVLSDLVSRAMKP